MTKLNYRLHITLLSEAIFSSGEKEPNLVQSRVLSDEEGFVYLHAKTLKGILKERSFWLLKKFIQIDHKRASEFLHSIHVLFGLNEWEVEMLETDCLKETTFVAEDIKIIFKPYKNRTPKPSLMLLGNLELPLQARSYFRELIQETSGNGESYIHVSRHDLISAQTHIRMSLQLENGTAKDKMLNSTHTVRRGLVFHAPLILDENPGAAVIHDLTLILYATRRIGAGIHRGNGEAVCKLLEYQASSGQEKGGNWIEAISAN